MEKRLVFVDVETSGGGPLQDRVIEIGMVMVDNLKVVGTYESLVNPNCPVQPEILSMTGIRPQELETAPEFGLIAAQIKQKLDGAVFVAHNARFDFGFIKSEFARLDERVWWPQLCTVRLSRQLFPSQRCHGLDALIERFGIDCRRRHRALGDALATWEFYRRLHDQFKPDELGAVIKRIVKTPALPLALAAAEMEKLPQTPGVYLFYGANNELLYIGKSINLRDRVWGHFYQDLENPRELALKNQVTRIKTRTTAGELEALLLEARLIKDLRPLYNRHLRRISEQFLLRVDKTEAIHRVKLEQCATVVNSELDSVMGIFWQRRQALNRLSELADKYQLCRRQLGLEKTRGSCFAYHLGECRGVCAGKEAAEKFNLRLANALAEIKLPAWPFIGLIGIREQSQEDNRIVHLFDQWCYLGSFGEEELNAGRADKFEGEFDLDIYHILRQYLKTAPASWVLQLGRLNERLTSQLVPGHEAANKY